jgi:hypothetical protein
MPAVFDPITLKNAGLIASSINVSGIIYSANGTGFAAQVLRLGNSYIIAFRGTDLPNTNDWGDVDNEISIGSGAQSGGQVTDLASLINLVISAIGSAANVTVTGQTFGGGLAILAGSIYRVRETSFFDLVLSVGTKVDRETPVLIRTVFSDLHAVTFLTMDRFSCRYMVTVAFDRRHSSAGDEVLAAAKTDAEAQYTVDRFLLWELDDPKRTRRPHLETAAAHGNIEAALDFVVLALFGSASADRSATGI